MAGHLGRDLVRRRGGRLDGQRQLLVAAPLLAQVGPDRLGEQRVPEPQPAATRTTSPVSSTAASAASRSASGQRGELGRGQLAARGGEHLGQVPRRARQGPVAARTAARRFGGGAARPAASARALSTASSGLPSAARTTWSTAWSVRSATLRATAASSTADSGPSSSSADLHAAAGQVGEQRVGVGAVRLVAPGQHEQHRPGGQPPADVRAQLQAGRVGAVHVLGHQ